MSATVMSVFILAMSAAMLVVWLRSASQAIRKRPFAEDCRAEAFRSVRLQYLELQELLREDPLAVTPGDESLALLQRDFNALTYLLRRTADGTLGGHTQAERLLMLDFKLLRTWVHLKQRLSVDNWRTTLLEMSQIVNYFGQVVGQRLRVAPLAFEPALATAGSAGGALLGMCSYCRNVSWSAGEANERWMTPRRYRERGGSTAVTLSHGVCPDCCQHLLGRSCPDSH